MAKRSKKALMEQVEKLIKTSVIVYVGLAALAILLMSGQSTSVVWEYSAKDNVATDVSNQLGSAQRTLFDFEYRYVLAGILAFSAVLLILLTTNYRRQYSKSVKNQISGFRWVYMGLSSAVMLGLIALIFGINDAAELKVIGLLIILTAVFSWLAERETAAAKKPKWFAYVAGLACGIVAWIPIVSVVIGTCLFGSASFDWYVYAGGAAALLGFIGFAYNQHKVLKGKSSYELGERNYFAIDLAAKSLVSLLLIIGFINS
jgi:hypothetical protein